MLTFGIIGAGAGVFRHHREALSQLPGRIVALADIKASPGEQRAQELGCTFSYDYRQMLRECRPDVAVILTPPFLHAEIACACLRAGCHVLVEKPLTRHVAEADAMIAEAQRAERLLAVVFQHRFDAEMNQARALLKSGHLGQLLSVGLHASWPRPAHYYQDVAWRATWAGEGGGVLMNQAPHDLDLLCSLFGLPACVLAWTHQLLHQQLETEDTVQAMLEWSNGLLGILFISTAMACQSRVDVVGTAGSLHLAGPSGQGQTACTYAPLTIDMRDFAATPHALPFPVSQPVTLSNVAYAGRHLDVYRSLREAIEEGQPGLLATGAQARMSLELANALLLSAHTHEAVALPLHRERYAQMLQRMQEHPKARRISPARGEC